MNELITTETKSLPEIVDETGKTLDAGVDVMGLVSKLAELAQLAKIRKSLEKEDFSGRVDIRPLASTDVMQMTEYTLDWPFVPLIGAFIINNGPNDVRIAINEPLDWIDIIVTGTRTISHSHAKRRIDRIYYVCAAAGTAAVVIEGQY